MSTEVKLANRMRKTIIIGLAVYWLLIIGTTIAQAGELTEKQQQKQKWFHMATVGDAVTTIIGAGCTAVKEVNPILNGASPAGVVGFFVVRNVAQEYITKNIIKEEWRDSWQNTWLGAQSLIVASNIAVLMKHC